MRFALIGNPNCGKTTLFNKLTGSTAHVGNWPGVTVDRKEGICKLSAEAINIIDLPGIYSTSPYSPEEIVSRDYIIDEKPDLIINIIDVTNAERNFYLTTELLETDRPMIIALNMMDEAKKHHYTVYPDKLEKALGVPVVPISASNGSGTNELIKKALSAARSSRTPRSVLEDHPLFSAVKRIEDLIYPIKGKNSLYTAIKLAEKDENFLSDPELSRFSSEILSLADCASSVCQSRDAEAEIADLRYKYISSFLSPCIKKPASRGLSLSDKLDMFLTNRVLAIPIFILIMCAVFVITFGSVNGVPMPGVWMQSAMSDGIEWLKHIISQRIIVLGATENGIVQSLIIDGIIGGIGSVISFLPQILLLFLFISILEASGYMARAVFIMDNIFRRFGLSGKSFVPMIMGFGCSVPAIMACRTIENEKNRRLTMLVIPFLSCGAKLPVYGMIISIVFQSNHWIIISAVYLLGIVMAAISSILISRLSRGVPAPLLLELPPYRIPSVRNLAMSLWEKAKHFLVKAGTVLFISTVIIWFLQNFDFTLSPVKNSADSILSSFGRLITPIFSPLGFGTWQIAVAILTGFIAREMIVSSLGILYGSASGVLFTTAISGALSPAAALSFMSFVLLAPPCIASTAAIFGEMKSKKWSFFAIAYQFCIAWAVSFIIYKAASLI